MTELSLLSLLLCIAFVLAPLMTNHFFLNNSKVYSVSHTITLSILFVSLTMKLHFLAVVWPLFCVFGFMLYLKQELKLIFSLEGLTGCIPFLFSLISATWFFAGLNDLRLLGYNQAWSFYAALHGSFLGWMFVGCIAFLAKKHTQRRLFLWGCYLSFVFFLLVAFGIDGVPYIKRLGLIGFSLIVPLLIGAYALSLEKAKRQSRILAYLSLFSIAVTMTLAILNEFWTEAPRVAFNLPIMVLSHGLLNAIVTIPCFYLAIRQEQKTIKD